MAGVGILVWSGFEDNDATAVAALGLLTATAMTMLLLGSRQSRDHSVVGAATLAGSLTGASASVITAGLMLFKDVRHAHPFPDFPPSMILGMLERLPHWTLAGALAGCGLGILIRLLVDPQKKQT